MTGTAGIGGASPVLLVRPDELRRAARLLRGVGEQVESLADGALRQTGLDDAWRGLAALEQQARTVAVRELVRLSARPGRTVAQALDRAAGVAESAGGQVRAWSRRMDECRAELVSLRTMGPPPDPLLEQLWRRRVQEVELELDRARCLVQEAEQQWGAVEQDVTAVVSGAWTVVTELNRARQVVQPVLQTAMKSWTAVRASGMTTTTVITLARARWQRSAVLRDQAWRRARVWFRQLAAIKPGRGGTVTVVSRARFIPGPVGWVLTYLGAVQDVRTGGGYSGWRGNTTRILAAGALAGGPMMVAGIALPPLGVAGVAAMTAYQAWTAGNLVWENRAPLIRYVRQTAEVMGRVDQGMRKLRVQAQVRASVAVTSLRERVSKVRLSPGPTPLIDLRAPAGVVLGRWVGAGPLRERLRQVGQPLQLPAVPLPPVLPPVTLGAWRVGLPGAP